MVDIYIKKYNRHEEKKATKRRVYVRYPYMRIKHFTGGINLPYSAMCVIGDNELNKRLRDIENPQHTDWEINRLNDYPEEKKKTSNLMKNLNDIFSNEVKNYIRSSTGDSVDFEGAGDYFPSEGVGAGTKQEKGEEEKLYVSKPKREQSLGSPGKAPEMGNKVNEESPSKPRTKSMEEKGNSKISNDGIPLASTKFKNFVLNPSTGEYMLKFVGPSDEKSCSIEVVQFGEGKDTYDVEIMKAEVDGKQCEIENGKIINLEVKKDKKYSINYICNKNEIFASEVKLYAHR